MKIRIAILCGGKSGEHEISIRSASSVIQALRKDRYQISVIGIDPMGNWYFQDPMALIASQRIDTQPKELLLGNRLTVPHEKNLKPFDIVLPILHGSYGEDGSIQGFLELMDVPYLGSGILGSAIGMDKDVTKRLLREAGLPIVPFYVFKKQDFQKDFNTMLTKSLERFGLPFFVKPCNLGSSLGVHKVKNQEDAYEAFRDAFSFDTKILVEQYIPARELECAILGNEIPQASVIGEVVPQHEFYSYEAKYLDENGAVLHIPAQNLPFAMVKTIQEMAIQAFQVLGCAGMSRVDFFLDKENQKLYINEVNTIPGFTSISMYPKLWEASGISYPDLLDQLIEFALNQYQQKSTLATAYRLK
jgi:D-alanine-D-alanine ligase